MTASGAGRRPLHMIRADLDVAAFHRWAASRGLIPRSGFDEGFAMHHLLVESFGETAPRPFRVILPRAPDRSDGVLYGYCQATADDLRDAAAAYADPLQAVVLPASGIDGKRMPETWEPGRLLGFEVLVRPIVRRKRAAPRRGHAERDAYQVEADPCGVGRKGRDAMTRSREEVYADWLGDRLERNGARLVEATLQSFQRVRSVRKLRTRPTEGPRALMRGTLAVSGPEAFASLLRRGVGRHCAYGYGMLLLRPARRNAASRGP